MKIPKSVATGVILATAVVLGAITSHLHPTTKIEAADEGSAVIAGTPTDRNPEVYQGSFQEQTLPSMLAALGVTVAPEDKVFAFPPPSVGVGSLIEVFRADEVAITDAGKTTTIRTWAKTVADLATEQNFQLADKDIIAPALTTAIPAQKAPFEVTITRVVESNLDVVSSIPYSTSTVNDASLDWGVKKVVTPGANGTLKKTYLVRRQDGVKTSQTLLSTTIVQAPVTQVTHVGTHLVSLGTGTASFYPGLTPYGAATQSSIAKGTRLLVTNLANGKSVTVTVNDRIGRPDRIIDLSQTAFAAIGSLSTGLLQVSVVLAPPAN